MRARHDAGVVPREPRGRGRDLTLRTDLMPDAPVLTVLAFGAAREIAGGPAVRVELPADGGGPATVGELHAHLTARYPALAGIGAVRYAVNQRLADDATPVAPADELAVIPPVSGG